MTQEEKLQICSEQDRRAIEEDNAAFDKETARLQRWVSFGTWFYWIGMAVLFVEGVILRHL